MKQQTFTCAVAICREMLVELGPCYIKAGQVLANRPDIIRQDYMDELCVLQDDVPSFRDDVAFRIIEENLGRRMEEVLSFISERPIAAASLGQARACGIFFPISVCLCLRWSVRNACSSFTYAQLREPAESATHQPYDRQ
jgi:ABC1 atypical kinase-like domain